MKNSINQFVRSCGLRTWGRRGGRNKKGEKVYVPSLDHFVPFNCCKCTVINPGNFFVSFTAIKCVCQPPILIFFFYRPKRLDYEQSPIFPQGRQRERNASERQKSLLAREARRGGPFLAWGDCHARLRFARSTIPEEKWGTTCSLETTYEIHTLSHSRSLKRFSFQARVSPFWRLQGVSPGAYASVQ